MDDDIRTRAREQERERYAEQSESRVKAGQRKCVHCGAAIEPGYEICPVCGWKSVNYCTFCGAPMRSDDMDCMECGMPAEQGAFHPSPQVSPQPAPQAAPQGTVAMFSAANPAPVSLEGNGWKLILQNGEFGRSCGIWPELSACQYVSGRHGRVQCGPGRVEIVDVGSTNGTYLNGVRLQTGVPAQIKSGDRIKIATLDFIVK